MCVCAFYLFYSNAIHLFSNRHVTSVFDILQGRAGIVKQIYRGTVFLYDEVEQENGGYFCSKAQNCEKIKLSSDACKGKVGVPWMLKCSIFCLPFHH